MSKPRTVTINGKTYTRTADTLNEMFRNPDWVEQKPCPRCGEVIWWHIDGPTGQEVLSPQVHGCKR